MYQAHGIVTPVNSTQSSSQQETAEFLNLWAIHPVKSCIDDAQMDISDYF
jgi:hypothetical protein